MRNRLLAIGIVVVGLAVTMAMRPTTTTIPTTTIADPTTTTTTIPTTTTIAEPTTTTTIAPVPTTSTTISPDVGFQGVYDDNGVIDPDVNWANVIGPGLRERISDAVESYLAEPDIGVPSCWEDEAIVIVLDHVSPEGPYVVAERAGELGCVPLDNLPVTGYRP